MSGLLKYFGDRGGESSTHGAPLHWPGTVDGYPFRGNSAPLMKKEELADVPLTRDFKSKMFHLWIPEEKAEFDAIKDRIESGWFRQRKREDHWIADKMHYVVWLEWVQIYGMANPVRSTQGGESDDTESYTIQINQPAPQGGPQPPSSRVPNPFGKTDLSALFG